MSRILLDYQGGFTTGRELSIQIEQIDLDRGYIRVPMNGFGDIRPLPLTNKAQLNDIIHIPTPYDIQERDDGDQSQE